LFLGVWHDVGRNGDPLPLTSHAAHCIGAIGELLNFACALVLAADLFLPKKEAEAKLLDPLGEWGRKHGLFATHRNVPVSDLDFTAKVLERSSVSKKVICWSGHSTKHPRTFVCLRSARS
jgi:hypothetical protein